MLAETQTAHIDSALNQSRTALEALQREQTALVNRANLNLIKAIFPIIDSIEAGIASGAAQVATLRASAPDAAEVLSGWLVGQRLLLERLIALLEAERVKPIQTVGQAFDPYRHIATRTADDSARPSGVILAEERRGYLFNDEVLRYAEVVVNKPSAIEESVTP